MNTVIAFIGGLLFATGLAISGMTRPEVVIGFLDVFGAWNGALVFVLAGAVGTMALVYRLSRNLKRPLRASQFHQPTKAMIDSRLVIGSAIFGIGWGLAGLCPGPAVVSLPSLKPSIVLFVGSMLLGSLIFHIGFPRKKGQRS